jgi:hypothetical protein
MTVQTLNDDGGFVLTEDTGSRQRSIDHRFDL